MYGANVNVYTKEGLTEPELIEVKTSPSSKMCHQEGELRIYAANVVLPSGVFPAVIEISNGKIVSIDAGAGIDANSADLKIDSGYLSAGLIDLQINGAYGTDFMAANSSDWERILTQLPESGVTAIYPTVITAPVTDLVNWFNSNRSQVKTYSDRTAVLGFHLEGPFLSIKRKGAHRAECVIAPTDEAIESLISAAQDSLKIVTIAPEIENATSAIKRLVAHGVKVSVGHSDATADQVALAGDLGATLITHLFNAQSPVSHRDTGVAGQALIDERFTLGLIVDLHHVVAQSVLLAFKAAQSRVCLVTDAISALGMPAGEYELAGESVSVKAGQPPVRSDGTLAGSAIRLDHAISNCIKIGVSPGIAIAAATKVPAEAMGLSDRGTIEIDNRADLVWLDYSNDVLETKRTWIAGNEVFAK